MPLKDLEKDIQSRESKAARREHNKTVYNEWESKAVESKESAWQKMIDKMKNVRITAIVAGGITITAIVLLLLATTSYVFYQRSFFAQDRVHLNMTAPQSVDSNKVVEIEFSYENDNRAVLENAEIVVRFGDYFIPEDNQDGFKRVSQNQGVIELGTIKGHRGDSIALAGHFVGPRDEVADISSTLRYVPERTSSRYSVDARSSTIITSSPISIDIESPLEIVSGNLMDIGVKVRNTSENTLADLKVSINLPEKFSLYNTEPRMSPGNIWLIDELPAQSEKVFRVRGGIDAPIGTVQMFAAELGTQESSGAYLMYANASYSPRIVRSPIVIAQKIETPKEGVVYAGETVRYRITFTNESDTPLRDAIVTLNLEGDAIDFEKLQLNDQGDYDQENRRIVWKASDVPVLQLLSPNESGEITFSATVKEQLPVNSKNDYHFSVTSVAAIDSEDIPSQLRENKAVLSNIATVPIGAKVILSSISAHDSGPQPPRVGEKTVYGITMKIDNINNDISGATVQIPLPTHTSFEGSDASEVTFNDRTNNIVWDIGDITHGAGVTRDAISVRFNVGIVPSVDQVEKTPVLIKDQILTAKDVFTQKEISETAVEKVTSSDGRFNEDSAVVP